MINDENYRNFPAVSNSDLGWLAEYWQPASFVMDCTRAFANGTLIDCMITEPARVDHYKLKVQGERYQYSQDEFEIAKQMKRSAMKDEFFTSFIKRCDFQKIGYNPAFNIEHEGFKFTLPAKCKWDLFRRDIDLGGDIKSTSATTQKQCEEAMHYFKYPRSRAWYMDIDGKNNDILFFISNKNFKVFKIIIKRDDPVFREGKKQYQELAFKWFYLFGDVPMPAGYDMAADIAPDWWQDLFNQDQLINH